MINIPMHSTFSYSMGKIGLHCMVLIAINYIVYIYIYITLYIYIYISNWKSISAQNRGFVYVNTIPLGRVTSFMCK